MWKGLIDKYESHLNISKDHAITLGEGNTPLIRAHNLEKIMPGIEIYLKYEGLNPTGSFKDRGMTLAVSHAVASGSKAVICASTGNTSASASAYAAKAGIKSIVIIPNKDIALGKIAQAIVYGAKIIPIEGNFDDALNMVKKIALESQITMVNSINPHRIEGQKTAAFELCDQLEEAADSIFIPVGNAGNITAYWKGFNEYFEMDIISKLPKLFGFQAAGSAPIVDKKIISNPKTIATAIKIGNPASWDKALSALEESSGSIKKIDDEAIMSAYKLLASSEGIFSEPASCITIAGLLQAYKNNQLEKGSKVVCILTGNGLKDPECGISTIEPLLSHPCDYQVLKNIILKGGS